MLIGVGPKLFFRAAHHQKVCDDLVSGAHNSCPCVPLVADRVKAEGTQRIGIIVILTKRYGRSAFPKDVSDLAPLTDFREVASQQILFVQMPRNEGREFLLGFKLGVQWPDRRRLQGSQSKSESVVG